MLDNESKKQLKAITNSIDELMNFRDRTKAPNPVTHRYIGTIVDNTLGLLCSVANSLDKGCRKITFDQMENWTSLMQAVYRSFFSSLHIAIEKALLETNVKAESSEGKRYIKIINEICENEPQKKELLEYFTKRTPSFSDLLDALLKDKKMNSNKKTIWRKYFKALSILRNKASHSDTKLSDIQRQSLIDGGFKVCVSQHGELQANTNMYAQIVKYVLDFLDEMNQDL